MTDGICWLHACSQQPGLAQAKVRTEDLHQLSDMGVDHPRSSTGGPEQRPASTQAHQGGMQASPALLHPLHHNTHPPFSHTLITQMI